MYVVSGKITCDGEPVQEGHIALVPLDGSLVPDNAFFKDGKYSLLARPGEKRVEIRASRVRVTSRARRRRGRALIRGKPLGTLGAA